MVETNNNIKKRFAELKTGDYIKGITDEFCHNYENKFNCVADTKHYSLNKIINITSRTRSAWKLQTYDGDSIICSLNTIFFTMKKNINLNIYNKILLADIFDDYEALNSEQHNLVMVNGFSQMIYFNPMSEIELIQIEIETNNPIFVNNFLIQ